MRTGANLRSTPKLPLQPSRLLRSRDEIRSRLRARGKSLRLIRRTPISARSGELATPRIRAHQDIDGLGGLSAFTRAWSRPKSRRNRARTALRPASALGLQSAGSIPSRGHLGGSRPNSTPPVGRSGAPPVPDYIDCHPAPPGCAQFRSGRSYSDGQRSARGSPQSTYPRHTWVSTHSRTFSATRSGSAGASRT